MVTIKIDDRCKSVEVEIERSDYWPESMLLSKIIPKNHPDRKGFLAAAIAAYDIAGLMKLSIDDLQIILKQKQGKINGKLTS